MSISRSQSETQVINLLVAGQNQANNRLGSLSRIRYRYFPRYLAEDHSMKRILVSVLGIPLLIVLAWGIRFHLPGPRGPASEPAREGPSAASSSAELDELRTQVKAMERQLSLTQSLL